MANPKELVDPLLVPIATPDSTPVPLPLLALVETPHIEAPRKNLPLGERQRLVMLNLMKIEIDEELGTPKLKYSGVNERAFIEDTYPDRLVNSRGEQTRRKIKNNAGAAYQAREKFISTLENGGEESDPKILRARNLMEEIKDSHYLLENLSDELIFALLRREIGLLEAFRARRDMLLANFNPLEDPTLLGARRIVQAPTPEQITRRQNDKEKELSRAISEIPIPELPGMDTMSRENIVRYFLMLPDPSGDHFFYPDLHTLIENIGVDLSENYELFNIPKRSARNASGKFKGYTPDQAAADLDGFIRDLLAFDPDGFEAVSEDINKFMSWVEFQSIYAGSLPEDLVNILKREISYRDIAIGYLGIESMRQREGTVFDEEEIRIGPREIFALIEVFERMTQTQLTELGISIDPEGWEILDEMQQNALATDPRLQESLLKSTGPLMVNLRLFFEDPNKYLAGIKDPNLSTLLYPLKNMTPVAVEKFLKDHVYYGF